MAKKISVIQPEEEIPTEIMANSIVEISRGVQKMMSGRLNRKAIVLLIHKSSGVSMTDVTNVIDAIEGLEQQYINKPTKEKK